jgi:hypothetical protein
VRRLAIALALLGVAAPARAERAPAFLTLGVAGESTELGGSLSYIGFPDDDLFRRAWRVDVAGQWRWRSWMLYGQLSWSRLVWRQHSLGDARVRDLTAAGNVELGGSWVVALPAHELFVRGGVLLPTASNLQYLANFGTVYARVRDRASMEPGALWLRPGITLRGGTRGRVFFHQLDASVCVPIPTAEDGATDRIWTVGAGVGARLGSAAATVELVETFAPDVNLNSFSATLAYERPRFQLRVGYIHPFVWGETPPARVLSFAMHGFF